jgi:hypothetical protein
MDHKDRWELPERHLLFKYVFTLALAALKPTLLHVFFLDKGTKAIFKPNTL